MKFNNFEVTPVGNATLSILEGKLRVGNIGSSGLDGIMINVTSRPSYKIIYEEIPALATGGAMKTAFLSKTAVGQIITKSEEFMWLDEDGETLNFGYSQKLLPQEYKLVGYNNGDVVFSIEKTNCNCDESVDSKFWVIVGAVAAAVGAGAAIYAALKSSETKTEVITYYPNGRIQSKTTVTVKDPEPFDIVVDGETYAVTSFGIEALYEYPDSDDAYKYYDNDVAVVVTGSGLGTFEISNISEA